MGTGEGAVLQNEGTDTQLIAPLGKGEALNKGAHIVISATGHDQQKAFGTGHRKGIQPSLYLPGIGSPLGIVPDIVQTSAGLDFLPEEVEAIDDGGLILHHVHLHHFLHGQLPQLLTVQLGGPVHLPKGVHDPGLVRNAQDFFHLLKRVFPCDFHILYFL